MRRAIKKVLIVANPRKKEVGPLIAEMRSYFREKEIETELIELQGQPPEFSSSGESLDAVISVGGDGTVLFAARLVGKFEIPILAVNVGTCGFITETAAENWKREFDLYWEGKVSASHRMALEVLVKRQGRFEGNFFALNDLVVCASTGSRLVNFSVSSRKEGGVGDFRADGVVVSTPTGSTAYSLAAGGPILHPEMYALLVTPVSPFSLANRSLVFPDNEMVEVFVKKEQRTEIMMAVDGQNAMMLRPEDKIQIKKAEKHVRIICSEYRSFYSILRSKLGWPTGDF